MYGEDIRPDEEIRKIRNNLPNSIWLTVISQIMARLSSKIKNHKMLSLTPFLKDVKELLLRLARSDFHSVIFPLLFLNHNKNERNSLKKHVLNSLKVDERFVELIDKYKKFTQELIKVSNLMEEKWVDDINSALKYFSNNTKGGPLSS